MDSASVVEFIFFFSHDPEATIGRREGGGRQPGLAWKMIWGWCMYLLPPCCPFLVHHLWRRRARTVFGPKEAKHLSRIVTEPINTPRMAHVQIIGFKELSEWTANDAGLWRGWLPVFNQNPIFHHSRDPFEVGFTRPRPKQRWVRKVCAGGEEGGERKEKEKRVRRAGG